MAAEIIPQFKTGAVLVYDAVFTGNSADAEDYVWEEVTYKGNACGGSGNDTLNGYGGYSHTSVYSDDGIIAVL